MASGKAPRIEAVFVLDTTGSMSGLLEGAKIKIWSIANQMASGTPRPDIRFGLIGFRDRGDEYVTKRTDLTGDMDEIYQQLMGFTANGGGDGPEDVNAALSEAIHQMQWQGGDDVLRVIFVVGDAPPHDDYDGPKSHELAALAKQKGIYVNTIRAGHDWSTQEAFARIAAAGGGQWTSIAQDGGMVARATPYDGELSGLNRRLADTGVAYGSAGVRAEYRGKMAARAAMAPEPAAAAASYAVKAKPGSTEGDLLGALEGGKMRLDDIEAEMLPEDLKALPAPAQKAAIVERQNQRKELNEEIAKVGAKRDAWLKQELAKDGKKDSFDENVGTMLRDQAAKIGVKY
jgi:hypothetical protein